MSLSDGSPYRIDDPRPPGIEGVPRRGKERSGEQKRSLEVFVDSDKTLMVVTHQHTFPFSTSHTQQQEQQSRSGLSLHPKVVMLSSVLWDVRSKLSP